jgi:hypothetical protein
MLNIHEKYAEIIKISNQLKEKELREKADREFAQSIIIAEDVRQLFLYSAMLNPNFVPTENNK